MFFVKFSNSSKSCGSANRRRRISRFSSRNWRNQMKGSLRLRKLEFVDEKLVGKNDLWKFRVWENKMTKRFDSREFLLFRVSHFEREDFRRNFWLIVVNLLRFFLLRFDCVFSSDSVPLVWCHTSDSPTGRWVKGCSICERRGNVRWLTDSIKLIKKFLWFSYRAAQKEKTLNFLWILLVSSMNFVVNMAQKFYIRPWKTSKFECWNFVFFFFCVFLFRSTKTKKEKQTRSILFPLFDPLTQSFNVFLQILFGFVV